MHSSQRKTPRNKRRDAEDAKRRASIPDPSAFPRCVIPGCGRPTMAAEGHGLARSHCKYHVERNARHGSHWHPGYRASGLRPYLRAAQSWLNQVVLGGRRKDVDRYIKHALQSLRDAMAAAPFPEIAPRLHGRPPAERAKVALARLREGNVSPVRILATYLAVDCAIAEDLYADRSNEFRLVQVAKAVHRLASGAEGWASTNSGKPGGIVRKRLYPRSSGRVLRFLGEAIEAACEWAAEKHGAAILALKVKRYGERPASPALAPIEHGSPSVAPNKARPLKRRKGPHVVRVDEIGGKVVRRVIRYD